MAERLLRKHLDDCGLGNRVEVNSAGVRAEEDAPASDLAQEVMRELWNLDLSDHRSKQLPVGEVEEPDLVLVMTEMHRNCCIKKGFASAEVFRLAEFAGCGAWDVDDPLGRGDSAYPRCALLLDGLTRRVACRLASHQVPGD